MSVNLYTNDVVGHQLDKKSQRSSLQKGGFASMMELLQQNQAADIELNDTFVQPEPVESEAPPQPKQEQAVVEKAADPEPSPVKLEPVEERVLESIPVERVVIEITEDKPTFIINEVTELITEPIETGVVPVLPEIEQNIAEDKPVIIEVSETVIPLAAPTPFIAIESAEKVTAEAPTPQDVSDVIVDNIIDIVDPELPTAVLPKMPEERELSAQEIVQTVPTQVIPTKVILDSKLEPEKKSEKLPLTLKESFIGTDRVEIDPEIEEPLEIRFVRYVEEEVESPTFGKNTSERLEVAPELLSLDEEAPPIQNNVNSGTISTLDRSVLQNTSKADGVQASTISEKETLKDKLNVLKKTQKKTFAQLLKQAKEKADEFKPSFHSDVLKRLEVQVRDPAGVIQMEIAQKEAVIHVRAMVPGEIMQELHYLGQDIQDSLSDLGLELGTYELRSQGDEHEELRENMNNDILHEDTIVDDMDEANMLLSDYVVDRKI